MINFCNNIIKYSIYSLFFLVPLVFAGNTSELFEFNKMWLAFGLTILIALSWFTKMILEKKVFIQRTPLDIPLLLFLLSQIIATLFSLDQQVSWWGYYSRFNGGLLSTITYIFLFYALVSNFSVKNVLTLLKVTFAGGIITALWGLPSHFDHDPTCLVFRGTFDTSCWTYAFRPTIRVFSTLGQPAWFAAYLAVLIPLAIAYMLHYVKASYWKYGIFLSITLLFYVNLIFANTRAGFIGFVLANLVFWSLIYIRKIFPFKIFLRNFIIVNVLFLITNFFFGIPVDGLNKFTFSELKKQTITQTPNPTPAVTKTPAAEEQAPATESNITNSGNIRLYVWQGALDAWKSSPIFGTGVETFAFAYYKFRPAGHNLTSEWDYLYNKAHNEYLNYLTTTGLFGLGTYLAFIFLSTFLIGKKLLYDHLGSLLKRNNGTAQQSVNEHDLVIIGLFSGWLSILVTNFFGFSVVIMNLFLLLIPICILLLYDALNSKKAWEFPLGQPSHTTTPYQWTLIVILTVIAGSMIVSLSRYWYADTKYALGANLDHVGSYQDAYPLLLEAAMIKPKEAVYKDELAINVAVLATALAVQKDQTNANEFMNNAIRLSDEVVAEHPNNVVYWKNRVRLFYTLAQTVDPSHQIIYYQEALKSIQKASELAPTDAKIAYNLGVLYGQTGDIQKGIEVLHYAIKLKPDYRDPYFALGLFYHQLAVNESNYVINSEMNQKAIETYQYILTHINPKDEEVLKSLEEWK